MISLRIVPGESFQKTDTGIRNGDTVKIKIIKSLAGGKWQASLRGKLVSVVSRIALRPGTVVKTRAFWHENQLVLRIQPEAEGLSTLLKSALIPEDAAARQAFAALQRTDMPLNPKVIRKIRDLLQVSGRIGPRAAKIVALIIDKRIEPTEGMLEELLSCLDGNRSRGNPEDGSEGRKKQKSPEKSETIKALKSQIEMNEGKDSSLPLFNHIVAEHENWMFVPYRIQKDNWAVRGAIRLMTAKHGRILRVHVSAQAGSSAWEFVIGTNGDKFNSLIVTCNDENERKRALNRLPYLQEKLRNLSIKIDDNDTNSDYDGFSLGKSSLYDGINTYA